MFTRGKKRDKPKTETRASAVRTKVNLNRLKEPHFKMRNKCVTNNATAREEASYTTETSRRIFHFYHLIRQMTRQQFKK
jgi:hypothetical protein